MSIESILRTVEKLEPYSKGDVIFREGETGDVMYVVAEGKLDIKIRDRIIETVEVGGIVGEMSLIDEKERSATVVAATDCKLVRINKRLFGVLVREIPSFSLDVMRVMADRIRRIDEFIRSLDENA
ncbi:MAG: cyclic nucleotide-binding domain-containing protein [Planctomycetota bacterium]